jgi:regulator of sigma E protease
MLITILATVVVLGVLIFVHELGHFMTAKAVDIEVPRFSIGFGPRVFGFKRGETEYVLSLLPLGGYVKMAGTEDMEVIEGAGTVDDIGTDIPATERKPGPRDFDAKSLPARALVISAGVIMNLILAFVLFTVLGAMYGVPVDPGTTLGGVAEERLPEGAMALSQVTPGMKVVSVNGTKVSTRRELEVAIVTARTGDAQIAFDGGQVINFKVPAADTSKGNLISALEPMVPAPPVVDQIVTGGPADVAGMKPGDRFAEINGQPVTDWSQVVDAIERSAGTPLAAVVTRGTTTVPLTVTPRADTRYGVSFGRIGIGRAGTAPEVKEHAGIGAAIANGGRQTVASVKETIGFVTGMISGKQSPRNIGGPIMITKLSGQVARLGAEAFLSFMAMLSISLAVLNMLPIPVLDGGHLVFLAIEGIRGGRPLSMQTRMRFTQVGFVMIVGIMLWAVGNDVWRLIAG